MIADDLTPYVERLAKRYNTYHPHKHGSVCELDGYDCPISRGCVDLAKVAVEALAPELRAAKRAGFTSQNMGAAIYDREKHIQTLEDALRAAVSRCGGSVTEAFQCHRCAEALALLDGAKGGESE